MKLKRKKLRTRNRTDQWEECQSPLFPHSRRLLCVLLIFDARNFRWTDFSISFLFHALGYVLFHCAFAWQSFGTIHVEDFYIVSVSISLYVCHLFVSFLIWKIRCIESELIRKSECETTGKKNDCWNGIWIDAPCAWVQFEAVSELGIFTTKTCCNINSARFFSIHLIQRDCLLNNRCPNRQI